MKFLNLQRWARALNAVTLLWLLVVARGLPEMNAAVVMDSISSFEVDYGTPRRTVNVTGIGYREPSLRRQGYTGTWIETKGDQGQVNYFSFGTKPLQNFKASFNLYYEYGKGQGLGFVFGYASEAQYDDWWALKNTEAVRGDKLPFSAGVDFKGGDKVWVRSGSENRKESGTASDLSVKKTLPVTIEYAGGNLKITVEGRTVETKVTGVTPGEGWRFFLYAANESSDYAAVVRLSEFAVEELPDPSAKQPKLSLSVSSSDPSIFDIEPLNYSGGPTASFTVIPQIGARNGGVANIKVTVSGDDGSTTSRSLTATLKPGPTPSFNTIPDLVHQEGVRTNRTYTIDITGISDGDDRNPIPVTVTASSSNTTLVGPDPDSGQSFPQVNYASPSPSGTVLIRFAPPERGGYKGGSAESTIQVNVITEIKTVTGRFKVTAYDAPVPTLSPLVDRTLEEDAGIQSVFLEGIGDGDPLRNVRLDVTAVSDNAVLLPNPRVIYVQGKQTAELQLAPTFNQSGTANVSVTVSAAEGSYPDHYQPKARVTRTFKVIVRPVPDPVVAGAAGGLRFDGRNGRVQIGRLNALSLGGEATFEFWQRVTQAPNADAFTLQLEPEGDDTASANYVRTNQVRIQTPGVNGKVSWVYARSRSEVDLGGLNGLLNTWTHWAFVVSTNADALRIYKDGLLLAEQTGATGFASPAYSVGSGTALENRIVNYKLLLGGFAGELSEFRLWNLARSESEIRRMKDQPLLGTEGGLMVYYRFLDGTGVAVTDHASTELQAGAQSGEILGGTTWVKASELGLVESNLAGAYRFVRSLSEGSDKNVIVLPSFDPDLPYGDTLTYEIDRTGLHGKVAGQPGSDTWLYTPDPQFSGRETIRYTVTDDAGNKNAGQIELVVVARNDPPTVSSIPGQTIFENGTLTVPFTVSDPDTPPESAKITALATDRTLFRESGLTLRQSGTNWTITLRPEPGESGFAQVRITAFDGQDASTQTFTVQVVPKPSYAVFDLGELPGKPSTTAAAINERGEVVGWATGDTSDVGSRGFFFNGIENGGKMFQLPTLDTSGAGYSRALGLNNNGDVTGVASYADGRFRAFKWNLEDGLGAESMRDLGALAGGQNSVGYAINSAGDVAGASTTSGASGPSAMWRPGSSLGTSGSTRIANTFNAPYTGTNIATGINNRGVVVGTAYDTSNRGTNSMRRAFIYDTVNDTAPRPLGALANTADSVHTNTTAAAINNASVVAGTYARLKAPFGQVLTLDGTSGQVVSSGGPIRLDNTNQTFTIELWLKRNGNRGGEVFLSQGRELQMGFDEANRVYVLCGGSTFTGPALTDLAWHNVALVFDGLAGDRQLFLDGALVARDAITGQHGSAGPVTLGAGVGGRFSGEMDEVRFWSVARTAVQIRNGQYGWTGGTEAGLLARWSFDNGSLDDGNQIRGVSSVYTTDLTQPTGTAPDRRGTTNPYRLALETTRLTGSGVSAANVSVVGSRVYVPEGQAGLEIFETSTSGGLRRLGGFNTAGNATGATAVGNRVLVADGSNGLVTLDVSDSANPTLVNTYQTTNGPITSVRVSGNIAVVTANRTIELLDIREAVTARYTTNLLEITRANNVASALNGATNAASVLDNEPSTFVDLPFSPTRETGLLLSVTNQLAVDQLRLVPAPATEERGAVRGFRLLGGKATNATDFTLIAEGEFPAPNGTEAVTAVIRATSAYPAYKFIVTSLHGDKATRFGLAELDFLRESLTAQTGGTVTRLAVVPLTDAELAAGRTPDIEVDGTTGYIVGGRGVVQTVSLDPQRAALSLVSDVVRLNVVNPPSITAQPVSWTNTVGGSATFRVQATGDGLSYQWRRDGNPVMGANGPVLIVSPITEADAGKYTVVVSNSSGTLTSTEASLTLASPASQLAADAESTETLGQAVDAARNRFVAMTPLPTGSGWSEVTGASFDAGSRSLSAGGKVGGQPVLSASTTTSMSLNVTGPGTIRFAWKVSSEPGYDRLGVLVDNVAQGDISGEVDWQEKTVNVGSGSHTVTWSYSKDGSIDAGQDQAWVDAVDVLQGAAVGGQSAWRTGGNAPWTRQTTTTKDGVDAAASGTILDNQESWMETLVEGPGTLSFQWRVSSENNFDYLRFSVDGIEQDKISGTVDWSLKTVEVQGGRHTVRWAYTKDGSASSGSDKGWVDQVSFVSGLGLTFSQQPRGTNPKAGESVTLTASVGGASSYTLVSGSRTWNEAKLHAQAAGGQLAALTSESKWRDLLRQVPLSDLFAARAWIGLTDEATEGSYRWSNGENLTYSRWNAGEPNNSSVGGSAGEDYVQIATETGLWNDASGSEKASGYVLERASVVTYQWQKDGVNLAGATNSTLTLTNIQLAQSGGYRVIAQDSRGTVASQTAAVGFTPSAPVAVSGAGTSGLEVRVYNDNRHVDTSSGVNGEYTNVWSTLKALGFQPVGFFGTNFGSAKVVVVPSLELGTPTLTAAEQLAWSNYVARGNSIVAMDGNTAKWLNTWLGTSLEVRMSSQQSGSIARGNDAVGTAFEDDAGTLADLRVAGGLYLSTIAGTGTASYADGTGVAAAFNEPLGIAIDSTRNLYIAEYRNNRIRRVTPEGVVTTLAGSGTEGFADGAANSAQFRNPSGVAVDASGNVYVTDYNNSRIRKISPAGVVSTLAGSGVAGSADGAGAAAQFDGPVSLALDASGNIYVADSRANRIRRVTPSGVVSTFAGSGTAGYQDGAVGTAQFSGPQSVVVDASGNVYVSEYINNRIRKITPAGIVSTLAGSGTQGNADGDASTAQFSWPVGMVLESSGSLLVTDKASSRIRRVSPAGVVTTIAGDRFGYADGAGSAGLLASPSGVAVDAAGVIYIADSGNHRIRRLAAPVQTLAGAPGSGFADATGAAARFRTPRGVVVGTNGNVYVADKDNNRIRRITPGGVVTTLAGSGAAGFADGTGTAAQFNAPENLAVDTAGNLYVSDLNNHRIRKITAAGVVTTLAGSGTAGFADGTGTGAQLRFPAGLGVDASGNVFVADTGNQRIRKITAAGVVTTFAGSGTPGFADGTGASAQFYSLAGLVVDSDSTLYITDYMRIRKVTSGGVVTTIAGSSAVGDADGLGAAAQFYYPRGLALDGTGGLLVMDSSTHLLRRVTFDGAVTTIAGKSGSGNVDGSFVTARFSYPYGITSDPLRRRFYVTEDNGVRQFDIQFSASGLAAGSLPSGTRKLYLRGDDAIVASFPVGLGRVTYIGADWSNTRPLGSFDGGWVEVLNSAVVESARPASEPRLYLAGIRNPATLVPGATAVLQANAAGAGTVAYQWLKDGVAIVGETNGSYSVTAQAGATNRYSVRATVAGGPGIGGQLKLTNSVLGLAIHEGRTYLAMGAAGVEIWDLRNVAFPQKLGAFDTPGEARDVGVSKVGGVVFAYVSDGASGVQVWDVTSAANPRLLIGRDDGTATWVAMQANLALVTDPSGLQAYQIRTIPTISVHPVSVTRNWSQTAEFRVTAEGTPPLRYQWRRNGVPIADATGAVLTLTDINPEDAGWYQVEVSNNFATTEADKALSASAGLTVRSVPRLEMAPTGVARRGVPTVPIRRAFVYQDGGGSGELEDLGSLEPNADSEALGINDLGQVVGYSFRGADKRATLTVSGEVFDLNETLPEENGWKLVEARGINSRGEIVGVGQFNGRSRAFLLVPAATIGRKVVRPLGAVAAVQPSPEILSGNPQNDPANTFYHWSDATGKLYAVRPGVSKLSWSLSANPADTNRIYSVVANVWPRQITKHIAGAPVEIEPRGVGFLYNFQQMHYPVGEVGVSLDTSAKIFNASVFAPPAGAGTTNEVLKNQAYTVLRYLRTDGDDPNPRLQAPYFEIVRTFQHTDPRVRVADVPWDVATTITYTNHTDYPGRNGYVLFEKAFYDGAGPDRAYDRPTRTGPIIPVNALSGGKVSVDPLLVVWYQMNGIGVAWPGEPRQYALRWPVGGKKIVIASLQGSGDLPSSRYAEKRVYLQPDQNLPGFNLNEEHAIIADGKVFALRNDLNGEKLSEPFALLKYRNPQTQQWGMEAYKVVAEEAPFFFKYTGEAGKEIQPPLPLSVLPICPETLSIDGPGWEDYKGKLYARAAGPLGTDTNIVVRYHYPIQAGFYLPLKVGETPLPEGTCIPWLDGYARTPGTPVNITYRIVWPNAPTLEIGSTLTRPRVGLPDLFSMAKVQIIHDDLDPELTGRDGLAKLFDPLSPRTLKLAKNEIIPDSIRRVNINGVESFPDLPYVIRLRVSYDPINRWLSFSGHLDEAFGVGEPLLLPNVMSDRERDRIKLLAEGSRDWSGIVDRLYDLSRNPNQVDLDPADGVPDKGLRLGVKQDAQGRVVPEEFGALPKALTAGLGGVAPAQPRPGNALRFDGENDYVSLGNVELLRRSFTIEFWAKREGTSSGFARAVAAQGVGAGSRSLFIGFDGGDRFVFSFGGPADEFRLLTPTSYTDQDWHHWACTYDAGSGVQRILRDGQSVAVVTNLARPYLGVGALTVGAAIGAGNRPANWYSGTLEELRIWDGVAKNAASLQHLSQKRLLGSEDGLQAYYRFDNPSQPGSNDALVANPAFNDGQVFGAVSITSDAPVGIPPRFLTLVENNDPALPGLPVGLKVIRVDDGPFRGDLKILPSDNIFDERLTLRHSSDFGGDPTRVRFEWYYHPADDGGIPPALPGTDATGQIADLKGWVRYNAEPPTGEGVNDITLGEGKESSLITLSDNYFICRFRGYAVGTRSADTWSDWVGDPTSTDVTRPQLAEGWIKRVLRGLNPFDARTADFRSSEVNTFASMLVQAGTRYEGDIAFNPSADNVNRIGLIEAYETVLRRGRNLSIDGIPAVNFSPANNALLLAATKISDLYMLLGNEAYADAQDPTIGFSTGGATSDAGQGAVYGSLASSIFTFQNQLDSLLEEELVLLRGRDDTAAGVGGRPVYNKLFWNFTLGDGEVAYQQNYNISDQNNDGFIDEKDARILYPQGHGDAWGHYLTAIKAQYQLLQHTNFTWIPRTEAVLVAGAAVEVDFQDERKFARTAAQKAKTGSQIVDLTYRLNFVDDASGQWQGYTDRTKDRAWGVTEWARRSAQGAYFDWVTGNAILPSVDTDPTHQGIRKVDRTTVTELSEIAVQRDDIQTRMDQADTGLNPLGLAKGAVSFDLDPSEVAAGKTHFEQVAERAEKSLRNAVLVWDEVNKASELLRRNQDSVERFQSNVRDQERDYKNRLIEAFGYPYAGDIGPGKTYPTGYDGPDLYHYMYVPTTDLNGQNSPPGVAIKAFYKEIRGMEQKLNPAPQELLKKALGVFFPSDVPESTQDSDVTSLEGEHLVVNYPRVQGDYAFTAPSQWGQRRAPGEIQLALSDMVQAQARLKQMINQYDALVDEIEGVIGDGEMFMDGVKFAEKRVSLIKKNQEKQSSLSEEVTKLRQVSAGLAKAGELAKEYGEATAEALPKSTGVSSDVTAPARSTIQTLALVAGHALTIGSLAADHEAGLLEDEKEAAANQSEIDLANIDVDQARSDAKFEAELGLRKTKKLLSEEAPMRLEVYNQKEVLSQAVGRYQAAVAKGLRLVEERVNFRKTSSAATSQSRYQDMTFRIFRNDALQKYRAQFDLAARYVFMAATAYDYEVNLLGSDTRGGQAFLTDIIRQRSLGQVANGVPQTGRPGLADPMARLSQNFEVLKTQMGFNNPQTETSRFSIRKELFRIGDGSSLSWRNELMRNRINNLWDLPEFRRFCRPFAAESSGPQPGIVIRFPTTVTSRLNFFGWPLGGGDSSYDASRFATKVRSLGVWFNDYDGNGLAFTPRVYLVPVGMDVLRPPSGNDLSTREWRVVDQALPVPFQLGASVIRQADYLPNLSSLGGSFAEIRRFASFRAYHDAGFFDPSQVTSDSRLIGRSVWNTEWLLIIPGATFLSDADAGLDLFINTVQDIKLYFQTYSYSGN